MMLCMSGNGTSKTLSILIGIVAAALVAVIGVGIGLSLANRGDTQPPEIPTAAPATTSDTDTSESGSSSTTTTETTTSDKTSSPSPTSGKKSDTSSTRSSTTKSSSSKTSTPTTSTSPSDEPEDTSGQDFGTGRSDLDGLGFVSSTARCDSGDRAFAVVATEGGIKAAACETRSGAKYYRSDTPQGALSTEIIVDEGDRVVARNGSYKYQMSPEGLLVTKDNEVIERYSAVAWGTA